MNIAVNFKCIVNALCENPKLLQYYRPELDLFLETDASSMAIGMALLQSETDERSSLYPIAYGSKPLTDAETHYANIERELLVVVGGLEKIHYFTFGHPVQILTDHKPLVSISKKSLVSAPPRLQHLLLHLNSYNAELMWILGKDMIFSDHLSHNVTTEKSVKPTCKGLDLKIHDVFLNVSGEKCDSLAKETSKDPVLNALKYTVIEGWPKQRSECPVNLRDFWNYHDKLAILDGFILKGTCIAIPEQCRDEILDQLHEGHFGTDHTKLCVRDSVYCPQINKDIEHLIKTCEQCQENSKRNIKDPKIPRELPVQPWNTLETNLFTFEGHSFLLVVDVMSQFSVLRSQF